MGKTIAKAFPKELQAMDFKIGDHVKGISNPQDKDSPAFTRKGELLDAIITDLNPDGDIRIKVLKHTTHSELIGKEFEATAQELELL